MQESKLKTPKIFGVGIYLFSFIFMSLTQEPNGNSFKIKSPLAKINLFTP